MDGIILYLYMSSAETLFPGLNFPNNLLPVLRVDPLTTAQLCKTLKFLSVLWS